MKTDRGNAKPRRRDEHRDAQEFDTYKAKGKLPEPTRCPQCRAVFLNGRWTWGEAAAGAHEQLCPACHRINDKFPAGFLTLDGEFLRTHRDEILHLAQHQEAREKAEHPLERIIAIAIEEDNVLITTTGTHLCRALGAAVHSAYKGHVEYQDSTEDNVLRVHWTH